MIIKRIYISLLTPLVILSSCKEKVEFNSKDLSWVDIYTEGELLVFENINTSKKDTVIIEKKEVYHPEYDWMQHDKYQPQVARIWCKKSNKDSFEMLEIWKNTPKEKSFPSIRWENSMFSNRFLSFELNEVKLKNGKYFDQVYIFKKSLNKNYKIDNHKNNAKVIYWDRESGIIKYTTFDGNIWEKIN